MYNLYMMRNMLEIGRTFQYLYDEGKVGYVEEMELFQDAIKWSEEFEKMIKADTYCGLLYDFVLQKLKEVGLLKEE